MKFTSASVVEQVVWDMKLAGYDPAYQRSLINALADGFPPWSQDEQRENNIQVNVNFLPLTKIAQDGQRQLFNAFLNGNQYFSVNVDYGRNTTVRREYSTRITKAINRRMKRSRKYFEGCRSNHAALVLHGIGPSVWFDKEKWCPTAVGIEDVLVPSRTLLTMENLPFFAVFVQYTAAELYKITHGPRVDPGWNMDLVNRSIAWADAQYRKETSYAEQYSPEKIGQMMKENRGQYDADAVPTVDCWHFYFWDDDDKEAGWKKRVILDSPAPVQHGKLRRSSDADKTIIDSRGDFLYDAGRRKYAPDLANIVHWTFGNASSVGPFRYHAVRSLGFLTYSVCHLQNRLQCKFSHAAFESLMQYYRCNNPEDAERIVKVDLVNEGIIPEGLEFVKAQDRWAVNEGLVGSVMQMNQQTINNHSMAYTQDWNTAGPEKKADKTATQVMAEVNATSALTGSMLSQAYAYAEPQYREICRRFCIPNSKDPDVRAFRVEVLSAGVPEEAINSECWDITPERVLGGGNKTLQFAQIEKLMAARPLMDPEPQRIVLHDAIEGWTDNADLADELAPVGKKQVSDSRHDAQLAAGTLMQGLPVDIKTGMDHGDYVEQLLGYMAFMIKGINAQGGMAPPDKIIGLQTMANHIQQHISIIAQDPQQKEKVREYGDALGNLMNEVKAYAQRLQEAQKKQASSNGGGMDPKDIAKLQGMQLMNQAKAANMRESHAARTAQRQVQWEMEQKRKQQEHAMDMQKRGQEHQMSMAERAQDAALTVATEGAKTREQIRLEGLRSIQDENA